MISAEEVVRRIELYFEGGALRYLTEAQAVAGAQTVPGLEWEAACAA